MLTSVLIFFNALIVELNALLQLISLLCLLVYTFTRRKTHWAGVLLFFLAAFLGLLVTVLAPGNAARMTASIASRFSPVLLLKTLGVASIFGAITIAKFFLAPITYVFLLFLPDLVRTPPLFRQKHGSASQNLAYPYTHGLDRSPDARHSRMGYRCRASRTS